jgi:LysR family transcriptional regulator, glycine cleavage system transcriptional activator
MSLIASSAELAGIICFCLIVAPWRDDGPENLPCRDHPICLRGADGVHARFINDDFDVDIVYGPVRATGVVAEPLAEETVTPLCSPALAERIAKPSDLLACSLILSDNKQVRWPQWLAANGLSAAATHAVRFDHSFLALGAAADGLGVALESTMLAERELRDGRLVAPLAGKSVDVTYVGHHIVYPRATHQRRLVQQFVEWVRAEMRSNDGA